MSTPSNSVMPHFTWVRYLPALLLVLAVVTVGLQYADTLVWFRFRNSRNGSKTKGLGESGKQAETNTIKKNGSPSIGSKDVADLMHAPGSDLHNPQDGARSEHIRTSGDPMPPQSYHLQEPPEGPTVKHKAIKNRTAGETCWDEKAFGPQTPKLFVNMDMCRASQAYEGDQRRLRRVMKALLSGKCITVLVIGGSATEGYPFVTADKKWFTPMALNSPRNHFHPATWPAKLSKWLNVTFPCKGEGHEVYNLAEGGKGSNFYSGALSSWLRKKHPAARADLIITEFAGNDVQIRVARRGESDEGQLDRGEQISYYTELVVRQILSARKRPALIYLLFTWFHPDKPPYHKHSGAHHLKVLKHYGVPQVSTLSMIKSRLNNTVERNWAYKHYFCDHIHPRQHPHTIAAQVLAFMFEKLRLANRNDPEPMDSELPAPLVISQSVAAAHDLARTCGPQEIDILDTAAMRKYIVLNEGWEWRDERNGPRIKRGLIAERVGACLVLGIQVKCRADGSLFINFGLLKSYERHGILEVTILALQQGTDQTTSSCNTDQWKQAKVLAKRRIDCLWEDHISVFDMERFVLEEPTPATGHCLWIVSRVVAPDKSREQNKVKLLSLSLL